MREKVWDYGFFHLFEIVFEIKDGAAFDAFNFGRSEALRIFLQPLGEDCKDTGGRADHFPFLQTVDFAGAGHAGVVPVAVALIFYSNISFCILRDEEKEQKIFCHVAFGVGDGVEGL